MKKAVIFDVDSTIVTIEGLDWLATQKQVEKEVIAITKLAMGGNLDFSTALKNRLEIIKPHYTDLLNLSHAYINNLTPGVPQLLTYLKSHHYHLYIVSGGFQPAVNLLAKFIGINYTFANQMEFNNKGYYQNFDSTNPLAHTGGKATITKMLREKYRSLFFIGDGTTDLESKPFVDKFIGFGGVVQRSIVKNQSDVYINNFQDLPSLL